MRWAILALLILPALEIGLFVWAGGYIGPWWVIFLIILTGIVGITIAKQQGIKIWNRARMSMNQYEMPSNEIIDGLCIIIGAAFVFTPGFITDTLGFFLVLPWTRPLFKTMLQKWIQHSINRNKTIFIFRKS